MKKIILLFILFYWNSLFTQTFEDINSLSTYIGRTFPEMEQKLTIQRTGQKTRLGLETRSYNFKKNSIIVSELDDTKTIGEISIDNYNIPNSQEKWYNIVSAMNKNSEYSFVRSYVADPEDKITTKELDYSSLIKLLRDTTNTSNWVYEMIYEKKGIYFKIMFLVDSIVVRISKIDFEK